MTRWSALALVFLAFIIGQSALARSSAPPEPVSYYILTGGGPLDPIYVDDDLTIYVNDMIVFQDGNMYAESWRPIVFFARPGDRIRITATNAYGGGEAISPIALHHPGDYSAVSRWNENHTDSLADVFAMVSPSEQLDARGIPARDGGPGTTTPFYDRTFVVGRADPRARTSY